MAPSIRGCLPTHQLRQCDSWLSFIWGAGGVNHFRLCVVIKHPKPQWVPCTRPWIVWWLGIVELNGSDPMRDRFRRTATVPNCADEPYLRQTCIGRLLQKADGLYLRTYCAAVTVLIKRRVRIGAIPHGVPFLVATRIMKSPALVIVLLRGRRVVALASKYVVREEVA